MSESTYDSLAADYDSSTLKTPYFAHLNSRYREILTENLPRLSFLPTLDLGCGTGLFMDIISRGTSHYIGIDVSKKMLGRAKPKSEEIGKSAETSLLRADASHLPIKPKCLGAVVSVGMVLPHLHSYETGLNEISKILCSGGRFLLELDNKWSVDLIHYFSDALTAGKIFSYGFSNIRQISRYIQQGEYEWDAKRDGVATEQKILLHKISNNRLRLILSARGMQIGRLYAIHIATLFMPKEFPRNHGGIRSKYLEIVEWLDRRLSRSYPFFYLGGSLIVVGKKVNRDPLDV